MAKVTFEVPASLVGDVYIAVGKVLQAGQEDRDTAGQADADQSEGGDDVADGS